LPRLSNAADFSMFDSLPDVRLRYVRRVEDLGSPDLTILPDAEAAMDALLFLKQSGLALAIQRLYREGRPIAGICGGFQMLGHTLRDPHGAERPMPCTAGLGLLDMETWFATEKRTTQAAALGGEAPGVLAGIHGSRVNGYEIHMGRSVFGPGVRPFLFPVCASPEHENAAPAVPDSAVNHEGTVFGTYLHGLFDSPEFTQSLCDALRSSRGLGPAAPAPNLDERKEAEYSRLAAMVETNLDMQALRRIIGLENVHKKGDIPSALPDSAAAPCSGA
jgi:adenosylcobyric acid synthase